MALHESRFINSDSHLGGTHARVRNDKGSATRFSGRQPIPTVAQASSHATCIHLAFTLPETLIPGASNLFLTHSSFESPYQSAEEDETKGNQQVKSYFEMFKQRHLYLARLTTSPFLAVMLLRNMIPTSWANNFLKQTHTPSHAPF